MRVHRIDLTEAPSDKARMVYEGEKLGTSRHPLFAAARKLLADGRAAPEDRIETWRETPGGEIMCLAGPVWAAAKLEVGAKGNFQLHRPGRWRRAFP